MIIIIIIIAIMIINHQGRGRGYILLLSAAWHVAYYNIITLLPVTASYMDHWGGRGQQSCQVGDP